MRAIVNVRLHERCGGPGVSTQQRFDAVMSRLRQFFPRSIGELTGDIAVSVFDCVGNKAAVLDVFHKLCKDWGQDYIEILFCDGQGRITGPDADLAGPFQPSNFIHPTYFLQKA